MTTTATTDDVDATEVPDARRRSLPALRWIVGTVIAAGVVVRIGIFTTNLAPTDSDEAITGLMALRLLQGEPTAFFWGQAWGGTAEVAPVALSLGAFGTSSLALRIPTLLLSVAVPLLVWRVARRSAGEAGDGRAVVAGLAAWIWPPAAVWFGTREMLFYLPVVVLGLVIVLLAQRIVEDPARRIDWAWLGLAAGLGWWTSPSVVYFAVPTGLWLLWRLRAKVWPGLALAAPAAVVGALPWIVFNVRNPGASFDYPADWVQGSYLERLWWFFTDGLPGELGLRVLFSGRWFLGPVGMGLYLVALGLLAAAIVVGVRRRTPEALLLAAFPLLFALNPLGMSFGNLRYLFFLAPLLALPLVRVAVGPVATPCLLAGLLAFSALVLTEASSLSEDVVGVVPDMDPLIEGLAEHGVEHVWADYWIAYRLTFESDEAVVAAPTSVVRRYQPYEDAVRGDTSAVWVTVTASAQTEALREALVERGLDIDEWSAGEYTVLRPSLPVFPEDLPVQATNMVVL